MIKSYRVLRPIGYSGRREIGEIVEIDESYALAIGPEYVEEVKDGVVTTETKTDETPVEEMSHKELKEKAKDLNLPIDGSKADLIERITLAQKD